MFNRTKLRQILTKHRHFFEKAKFDKFESQTPRTVYSISNNLNKTSSSSSSNNSNRNTKPKKSNNDNRVHSEYVANADVVVSAKNNNNNNKEPPTEYFRYSEKDFIYVKTNENVDYNKLDTFHRAVCPIIILGQCFALLPLRGVRHANPRRMRFAFKSLPMLVTLIYLMASSILTLCMLKNLLRIGINAKNLVGLVFFGCVQFACVLFLSLAKRWPHMMRFWVRIELIFLKKPYEIPARNLAARVRFSAAMIIFLSVVEHSLYQLSAILSYTRAARICAPVHNTTGATTFNAYMTMNYDYVFTMLPYHTATGIFILIINGACTFVWNYMDLFIMMVSKGIAYRFEQITARIKNLTDKEIPESTFIEIREHYVKVCELLEYVDENLSGIILLSCMNNLYFVCYQLLNVFNKLRWPINYVYFWYSLLYLIGRTAFVFLTAASINDESKGALSVLRRVSSKTWCVEVERLIFQMTTQTVALSGKKFYFLTRRLLFGMAGTIVTYELVLLQFDEPNRTKGLPPLCG